MEIERKWLIDPKNPPFSLQNAAISEMEQAYIAFDPSLRIRSVNGKAHYLTIKTLPADANGELLIREEYEIPISPAAYAGLLPKAEGTVIHKTRYRVPLAGGLTAEIDRFHGALTGLAYLEIEFPDAESALRYPDPPGVLRDVSNHPAFTNGALARDGYPAEALRALGIE